LWENIQIHVLILQTEIVRNTGNKSSEKTNIDADVVLFSNLVKASKLLWLKIEP